MKEYLKMSDVFGGEVFYSGCKVVMSGGAQSQYSDAMLALDSKKSEYAAHAINSHDELVEMNKEMLNVLESIENDAGQVPEFMWDMVQNVIAKAKGGAA